VNLTDINTTNIIFSFDHGVHDACDEERLRYLLQITAEAQIVGQFDGWKCSPGCRK